MGFTSADEALRKQAVMELTRSMVHRHYCENDVELLLSLADEDIVWIGAAEQEYAAGKETIASIFRQFDGKVPKCNISDEEYHVIQLSPESYLCSGRMWISTDASTQISLRVHQRITTVFRWSEEGFRCCHIHISNPYGEMAEDDIGFPTKMAKQSYQYLQEQISAQKAQISAQTAALQRMSYEDTLTGLYNRNKFNQALDSTWGGEPYRLGIAYFDLNGLKEINDRLGHSAGDALIRSAAEQLRTRFDGMAYRIGGDEFVVIDSGRDEADFQAAVAAVQAGMREKGIHCSVGISWRSSHCNPAEQFDEADRQMYLDKRRFYNCRGKGRRSRRKTR